MSTGFTQNINFGILFASALCDSGFGVGHAATECDGGGGSGGAFLLIRMIFDATTNNSKRIIFSFYIDITFAAHIFLYFCFFSMVHRRMVEVEVSPAVDTIYRF